MPRKSYKDSGKSGVPLPIELNHPIEFMRFTLIYDGPLPAQSAHNSHIDYKQEIRAQIHPQLAELWTTHPAIHKAFARWVEHDRKGETDLENNLVWPVKRGNFRFVSLVRAAAYLTCELDILFLRQENKGRLLINLET